MERGCGEERWMAKKGGFERTMGGVIGDGCNVGDWWLRRGD
jgi:hypothetical protein